MKNGLYLVAFVLMLSVFGCGNKASNTANNTDPVVKALPANTPQVVVPSANARSNANSNANAAPKTSTTPGIPNAEQIKKQPKPGVTPTPGIPDEATMRKLMGQPRVNVNVPASNIPMKKSGRKLGGKIQ